MNPKEPINPEARAVLDSFRRIVQGLRLSSAATQEQCGLSGAQAFVLQKLGEGAVASLNELARRTHTHQSSVSVVVEKLAREGLVTRSPAAVDGRQIEIALTAGGRRLLKKIPETLQEKLVAALASMEPGDRATLARLLQDLTQDAGLPSGPPMLFFEMEKSRGALPRAKGYRKGAAT